VYLQINELVSHAVPIVFSNFTARNFEYEANKIGCIGTTEVAFKQCVLDLYTNKSYWNKVQKEGLAFVKKKYEKTTIKETWSKFLSESYDFIKIVRGSNESHIITKEPEDPKYELSPKLDVPEEGNTKRNRVVMGEVQTHNLSQNPNANATNPKVSLLILTYNKASALQNLLESIFVQDYYFELIVADNGCKEETINALEDAISKYRQTQHHRELVIKYYPLCENLGYAGGNNAAVKIANNSSDWILLLNDDIVMKGKDFVKSMMYLAPSKGDCVAVGCTLLNGEGTELIEARSIAWQDGSAAGFGRGRNNLVAPEFAYARAVDYVSGACLMVNKNIFNDYGGFDGQNFPNYYEDTDLQMHIQHDIHKEVWMQVATILGSWLQLATKIRSTSR